MILKLNQPSLTFAEIPTSFTHSPVAGIIKGNPTEPSDLEILLIKRVSKSGDPWSEHLAFPGGMAEEKDKDLCHTAIRETKEEVGLDLTQTSFLGWMDYHSPRSNIKVRGKQLLVIPHFFYLSQDQELLINKSEVASAFWVPFSKILGPENYREQDFLLSNNFTLNLPSLSLNQGHVWGITYVLLVKFLHQFLQQGIGEQKFESEKLQELLKVWRLDRYL